MYKAKIPLRCWPLSQTRIWKAASKTRKKQQNLRLSNYHNTLSVDSGTVREPGQSTDCRLYVRVHRNNHQTRKFSGEMSRKAEACVCAIKLSPFSMWLTPLWIRKASEMTKRLTQPIYRKCVCVSKYCGQFAGWQDRVVALYSNVLCYHARCEHEVK